MGLALGTAFSGTLNAASYGTYSVNPTSDDGRLIPGFYPNVEADLVYDDNITRVETGEQDSLVGILRPELQWIGVVRKHLIRIGYQGEYANFEADSDENYLDHYLGADVTLDLTPKFNLNLAAYYTQQHEARSVAGAGVFPDPNEWDQWSVSAQGVYGRRTAKAQVALKGEHLERDYTNNGQEARDYDSDQLALTLYYNIGPKTQLLVEPVLATFDYTDPTNILDNDVTKLLVGVTWEATAKTTGQVKVGWVDKDFDNAAVADSSSLGIDAKVIWEPKTYSKVTTTISRDIYDASALGSFSYESLAARVDWVHDLTNLTQMQAGLFYEDDDYNGIVRSDQTYSAYLGISYALRRWLTVGARYDYESRDSSVVLNDYDDNRITIGVRSNFE